MPNLELYRAEVKVRNGRNVLAWVKAENEEDAEDLLGASYGHGNVSNVARMRDLDPFKAEVIFGGGDRVLTEILAENGVDARRSLRTLYGRGNFELLG